MKTNKKRICCSVSFPLHFTADRCSFPPPWPPSFRCIVQYTYGTTEPLISIVQGCRVPLWPANCPPPAHHLQHVPCSLMSLIWNSVYTAATQIGSGLSPCQFLDNKPTKRAWYELYGEAADGEPDTTLRVHSQSATDTAECGTQPGSDSGNSAGSGRRNSCQFLLFLRTASTDHIPASHPLHLGSLEQHDQ